MAKMNPLFGRMRGKYGGSVMYSYNGKQCMRERVIEVRNPRSSKQAIQRAILATCGRFVSAFAPILNNSIQSETSKVKTLAKIRSLNMDYLRGLAAAGKGQFNPKSSPAIMPNDYIVSRGSLAGLSPLRSDAARSYLATEGGLKFAASSLVISASVTASQAFPTIAVGDQITLLASYYDDLDAVEYSGYCRFAFVNDSTPVFVVDSDNPALFRLNHEAVDISKAAGRWANVAFFSDDNAIYFPEIIGDFLGDSVDIAAVIVSRESERLRSNSYAVASDRITGYPIDVVYPTYMDGGSSIDMPSEVYLNNDASTSVDNSGIYLYSNGERVTAPINVTGDAVLGVIGGNIDIEGGLLVRYYTRGETSSVGSTPIDGEAHGATSSGMYTVDPITRSVSVTYAGELTVVISKMLLVVGGKSYTLVS